MVQPDLLSHMRPYNLFLRVLLVLMKSHASEMVQPDSSHVRPYNLLQIRYGTQWDVVSIGCTNCIKINFTDGEVLFLGIHYDFDLLN